MRTPTAPPQSRARRSADAASLDNGISPETVRVQLEKILASNGFSHSERLSRFLRFVVDEALQARGDQLKEYNLGVQVFDRGQAYDPRTDPIVRVEAGRLRLKLREYYESDGREDPVSIDFPKGSYVPVFSRPASVSPRVANGWILWVSRVRSGRNLALLGSILLTVCAIGLALQSWQRNRELRREIESLRPGLPHAELAPIWKPFFANDVDTVVVVGSPLFFSGGDPELFVRAGKLNDTANLTSNPIYNGLLGRLGALSGPRYDYTQMGDAIALQRLTAFFGRAGRKIRAIPAHQATSESIQDGNIIFLGAPRMIPLLKSLPVERDFDWDLDQNLINRGPQPGEQALYATPSHWGKLSYAVVGSFPGLLRPNREVILLTAHSGPGTLAALEYLTRPDTARMLIERLRLAEAGPRKHYEMLLRVFVDSGSAVKAEYVTHHLTPPRTAIPR